MRKDDNILMVGCGNSRLSEDMFDDGFTTLTNIDVSRVVVDQMAARYRYTVYICCISVSARFSNISKTCFARASSKKENWLWWPCVYGTCLDG